MCCWATKTEGRGSGACHVHARRRAIAGRGNAKTLTWYQGKHIPLDGKSRDSWLLSQNVAADLLNDGLWGRIINELLALVLVVDVVANAHKFATVVGARQQYHRDAQKLVDRDALCVRRLGLEDELIDTNRDGANEEGVEFLVVIIRGGGADVG